MVSPSISSSNLAHWVSTTIEPTAFQSPYVCVLLFEETLPIGGFPFPVTTAAKRGALETTDPL